MPWRLRADRLRRKTHEAIDNRVGAERVARAYEATGGTKAAADAIESGLDLRPR